MSGQKPKPTVPESTASDALARTASAGALPPRRRMIQNYLVIWVDGNIDENTEDCRNTLAQLRAAVSESLYNTRRMCRVPQ